MANIVLRIVLAARGTEKHIAYRRIRMPKRKYPHQSLHPRYPTMHLSIQYCSMTCIVLRPASSSTLHQSSSTLYQNRTPRQRSGTSIRPLFSIYGCTSVAWHGHHPTSYSPCISPTSTFCGQGMDTSGAQLHPAFNSDTSDDSDVCPALVHGEHE